MFVGRLPWGEESLLREDTDESLWFFGPAGENNYRVAGVSFTFLKALFICGSGEDAP